jgi:hypothetical protein
MGNGIEKARHWTQFLASRPYLPTGNVLLAHFNAGSITRFCDCGCNSFELNVPENSNLEPLYPSAKRGGCVLSLAFHVDGTTDGTNTLEIHVHVDACGYLSGLDVDYCANSAPMPEALSVLEPPFHVRGALAA